MEQYFRTRASVDDNPDLARDRRANDARLKSRFEHIFAKYGRDFEGVGDEIDLETGRIIVNNGHIARMQHEVDPGQGTSAQVLRVLGGSRQSDNVNITRDEEPVIEDSAEDMDYDEELADVGASGYSGSDNDDEDESEELSRTWARATDELSSDFYPTQDATPERLQPVSTLFAQKSAARHRVDNDRAVQPLQAASRSKSPGDPPVEKPLLRESMAAMQALPGQRGSVDPDMIEALGQSIANQLAKFMTGDPKKPKRKSPSQRAAKDTRWEYPMLPGDRIERTPSPSLPESPSAALFVTSPNHEASVWAPQQQRRRRKSKLRSQVLHSPGANDDDDVDVNEHINPLQIDPPSYVATTIGDEAEGILDIDCYNCGATNSRLWRTGPGGRLCDSCGSYYRRYGLLKVVEDPSLTPALRPGQGRSSAHGRTLSTNQETDVFAIPSTDAPGSMAGYAANTARRVTGDGRNGRFTLEEEKSIIRHHEIDQLSWDHIGYLLSLRSAHSVHSHYQKFLKAPGCEARRRLIASKELAQPVVIASDTSMHHPPSVAEAKHREDTHRHDVAGFIEREDELIVRLREDEGMTWEQIAAYFPDRTSHILEAHYNGVLAENESLSSASNLNGHALGVQSGQRTINDSSPVSTSLQTNRNASVAREPIKGDFAAPGGYTSEALGIDATPSISHPYAMILNMTDEMAAPFKEMAQLFSDRNEEDLSGRYLHLDARPSNSEVHHTGTPRTSDKANTVAQGIGDGARSWLVKPASTMDTRTRIPPPHVPSGQKTASEKHHYGDPAISAGRDLAQHLHTPSVHTRQVSVPPRPSEVGPSAWAITQPVSKGPLPFQPARKGLLPIYPRSSSRGLYDPFISKTINPEGLTPSHVQNEFDMTGFTHAVSRSHPESLKSAWGNPAVGTDSQHGVLPDIVGNAAPRPDKRPAPAPQFTPEQDAFIKKAREKRRLPWAEIAATLPGDCRHAASEITHRYYDYLLGKRSANKTSQSQEARASANDGTPHGEVQSDQSSRHTQQGKSGTESTDAIPVSPSASVQNHGNDVRPQEAQQQFAQHQRHPQKPLLRRALKNSTRRNSDVANYGILPADRVQGSHQSSLGQDLEGASSSHSSVVSRLHELRPHSHPQVVISSGEFDDHDDALSKLSNAKTARGALSKAQRQPNHASRISDYNPMNIDLDKSHGQAGGWQETSQDEYTDEVPVPETHPKKGMSSSGTKRKRRRGRPTRISGVEVADSDSDVPYQGEDVLAEAQGTPPAKRGRGRPRKSGLPHNDAISPEITPEPEARALYSTEPISPKLRSGLVRPTIKNDLPSMTRNSPHVVFGTWTAPSALDRSPTVAHESTNRSNGGQDGQDLTFQTWEEILVACFRSCPGAELRRTDIQEWVRAHNAHYRNTDEPWIHHIYNEFYRNPAFEKADPSQRKSGYILVESKLRPSATDQAGGDGNEDQADVSAQSRSASAEHADINIGIQEGSDVCAASAEFAGQDAVKVTSTHPASAEPSYNLIGSRGSVKSDALVVDVPGLSTPVSRPTSKSANIVEVIDISSDSPVKQEPASEDRFSTSQAQHSTKHLLNAQERSPRAKHIRHSGPALVSRVSALATPARSSANSGRPGLHAQSIVPINFEPHFGEGSRASPAISIGTSGRRVVVATEVARDDGDEQDELS
jgi:hypothetical protein